MERQNANRVYYACIQAFVDQHDSRRLTAYELADASVAACTRQAMALRDVFLDQGYPDVQSTALLNQIYDEGKRGALQFIANRAKL